MFTEIIPLEKNWPSENIRLGLKKLSPYQFLMSSNSCRYNWALKGLYRKLSHVIAILFSFQGYSDITESSLL